MKKTVSLLIASFVVQMAWACTTAIISGKHTKDGRPMIWKLRDTDTFENKMMYFNDGKYSYVGVVNSTDVKGEQIWAGANSSGFAIMNSASFNVNLNDTTSFKDQEGVVMRKALRSCKSLKEFEKFLKKLPKPMGLASHFGVLDAEGNVAFYEVNNYTYTKYDANDPKQAPNGYIIRTNYSFTGKPDVGYGFIRYQTAENIFEEADSLDQLNYQTIIQDFSRCFKHTILGKDFRAEYEKKPKGKDFINSGDLITRNGSASSVVIQGVKKGESKDLATIWTTVGFPNTSLTLPVWVRGGKELPKVLQAKGNENAPLNTASLKLKKRCYPIERSSGYKYLLISELVNSEHTGIVQKLEKAEKPIFKETEDRLQKWSKTTPDPEEIQRFYTWLDDYTFKTYKEEFGIEPK